jgi:DegV family protein with EDD domain
VHIVTDRAVDLPQEILNDLEFHYVPLTITLDKQSYQSGQDIQPKEFYELLKKTGELPTTSLPAPGYFADLYRRLAATDPEILSIHISSSLSGTINAARLGAEMVPEAKISIIDTKTLSAAQGWQVEAACRAAKAGWSVEQIRPLTQSVSDATDTIFTLEDLKYLIHGGRIGHMKALIASVLNIKPIIGVEKDKGSYVQLGQARTFRRALKKLVDIVGQRIAPGSSLRIQVLHGQNPEGAARLQELFEQHFDCHWLPTGIIAPILGAHTGPSLVGAAYAPLAAYPQLP